MQGKRSRGLICFPPFLCHLLGLQDVAFMMALPTGRLLFDPRVSSPCSGFSLIHVLTCSFTSRVAGEGKTPAAGLLLPGSAVLCFPPTAADCVRLSVQNLFRLADTLPPPEVSEAVNLILGFVKDSYPINSALLLEFENGEGYPLLLKVLLR